MACDQHEIEYWLENNKVRNNDIESWKKKNVFKPMDLMSKGGITLSRGYLRKQMGREDA